MINIDEIKAAVPLSAVMPKKAMGGICPFCASGRFSLSVERGIYACRDCGHRGDVITATMKIHDLDFRSAVAQLQEGK